MKCTIVLVILAVFLAGANFSGALEPGEVEALHSLYENWSFLSDRLWRPPFNDACRRSFEGLTCSSAEDEHVTGLYD